MVLISERKVRGGKLVRVKLEVSDRKIVSAMIEGDFFVHPEEGLGMMEKALVGHRLDDLVGMKVALDSVVREKGLLLMGFSANDVVELIGGR